MAVVLQLPLLDPLREKCGNKDTLHVNGSEKVAENERSGTWAQRDRAFGASRNAGGFSTARTTAEGVFTASGSAS